MTKRRTPPTTTSSTAKRTTTTEKLAAFADVMTALMDHYMAHGCPCRFPRFRAHQQRDTAEIGAPGWTTWEQQGLMSLFDQRVPLNNKNTEPLGHTGECALCGASIKRWGEEKFRDAWLEHMRIVPKPGVADIGAGVHAPVPRANQFFYAGPANRDTAHLVDIHYPKVSEEDWFEYMKALATE
jgi:hypothetical protein